jgi:O-antigen/teichoic acid export membrane protein
MHVFRAVKQVLQTKSLRHTVFVYVGSLVNGGSLFLLNIILARALSKPIFGIFSLSVFVLSTIAEVSDFGLNAGLLRFAPYYIATGEYDKLSQLVRTIWQWRVSLTVVLTAICAIFSKFIAIYLLGQPLVAPYLLYASLGIGGVILLGFLTTFLQASQRFIYQAIVQSLKGLLRLIIVIVLYVSGVRNLYAYLTVYVAVPWLLFLFNYRALPSGFRQQVVGKDIRMQLHGQLARFSFWLTVASLASILSGKADQVIISHYLGLEDVALSSATSSFSEAELEQISKKYLDFMVELTWR